MEQVDNAKNSGIRTAVQELIPEGSTIIELGSGVDTIHLIKNHKVYIVEDDETSLGKCEGSNYIHSPIVFSEGSEDKTFWYDSELLKDSLPENYDLLLIHISRFNRGIDGLIRNLDTFRKDIPLIFEQGTGKYELSIAEDISFILNRPMYSFKNFSIIPVSPISELALSRIQFTCLKEIYNNRDAIIETSFGKLNNVEKSEIEIWKNHVDEANMERLNLETLRADRRKLRLVEKSVAYRIGRIITLPFWPIYKLLKK